MKRFLAILGIEAVTFVVACNFDQITSSSVIVVCIVDNATLHLDPATGMVVDSALVCADMADSLSIALP